MSSLRVSYHCSVGLFLRPSRSQVLLDRFKVLIREPQTLSNVSVETTMQVLDFLDKGVPIVGPEIHEVDESGRLDVLYTNTGHSEFDELFSSWLRSNAGQEIVVHYVVWGCSSQCLQKSSNDTGAVSAS